MKKFILSVLFAFSFSGLYAQEELLPVKRPLVEEYTGLWCSFCPRGYVALEELNEEYGDRFVALSYHNKDAMDIGKVPIRVPSYPWSDLDRKNPMDPQFLKNKYRKFLDEPAPAEVMVIAEWSDSDEPEINITTTVTFVGDQTGVDYRIANFIVADGLENSGWMQENAYSFYSPEQYPGEWWALFVGQSSKVRGLVFNDIVVYSDNLAGDVNSLPNDIEAGRPITYSVSIPTDKLMNLLGQNIVETYGSYAKTRVVSAIIDNTTGEVLNCNKSAYIGERIISGVKLAGKDVSVMHTAYYTLDGREVKYPDRGVYIKVETLSGGTQKVVKTAL